jgi:hypothetical protein
MGKYLRIRIRESRLNSDLEGAVRSLSAILVVNHRSC